MQQPNPQADLTVVPTYHVDIRPTHKKPKTVHHRSQTKEEALALIKAALDEPLTCWVFVEREGPPKFAGQG